MGSKKQTKRISSNILKMDENNQYGHVMTKLCHVVVLKKKENPLSLTEFNRILHGISHDDPIGHLFIVDIKFKNINPKTLLLNELYSPISEKNKKNGTV